MSRVVAVLICLFGFVTLAGAQPRVELKRIGIWRWDEALPPRVVLEDRVTVSVTGTVVDVLRELATQHPWWWLVGLPPAGGGDTVGRFEVEQLRLSEALDRLLETHGYDWGFYRGVIICWPAMKPARPREAPAPDPTSPRPAQGTTLVAADAPVSTTTFLDTLRTQGVVGPQVLADEEMAQWRVAGKIGPGRPGGNDEITWLRMAVTGVWDGVGNCAVLKASAARRLDASLRVVEASPPLIEKWPTSARRALEEAILANLGAEQWSFVRESGMVEIAFRELRPEHATLFVQVLKQWEAAHPECKIDWSRPQDMGLLIWSQVSIEQTQHGQQDQRSRVVVAVHVMQPHGVGLLL